MPFLNGQVALLQTMLCIARFKILRWVIKIMYIVSTSDENV